MAKKQETFKGFDPRSLPKGDASIYQQYRHSNPSPYFEMVLVVGCPASGKSTFSRRTFVDIGYVHVNMDTLKSKDACLKAAKGALASKRSVVIDNTNPDKESRAQYIKIAQSFNCDVRCFVMTALKEIDICLHLNNHREKVTKGVNKAVPMVAFHTFKKKFELPTVKEGIKEVIEVPFQVIYDSELANNKSVDSKDCEEKLFRQFT